MKTRLSPFTVRGWGRAALVAAGTLLVGAVALQSAFSRPSGAGAGKKERAREQLDETDQVTPYEQQLAELINAARRHEDLRPLKLNTKLSGVARGHSEEMRDEGYMGHISPVAERSTPRKRYEIAFKDAPYLIGENVARRAGPTWCLTGDNIGETHKHLMASPHHRDNILHPEFEQVGVGIAVSESGDYWVTELFVCVDVPAAPERSKRVARRP